MLTACAGPPLHPVDDVRVLYATANSLETQIAVFREKLRLQATELAAHKKAYNAASHGYDSVSSRHMLAGRSIRNGRLHLVKLKSDLCKEEEMRGQHESDNKGLRRTLARLEEQFRAMQLRASEKKGHAVAAESAKDETDVDEACLRDELASMRERQVALERRLASQRHRRLELKAAVRLKLQREEEAAAPLREQLFQHDLEMKMWTERVNAKQFEMREAEVLVLEMTGETARAGAHAEGRHDAKLEMQKELVHMQFEHKRLRDELVAIENRLVEITREEEEARMLWRRRHLERLDSQLEARAVRTCEARNLQQSQPDDQQQHSPLAAAEPWIDDSVTSPRAGCCSSGTQLAANQRFADSCSRIAAVVLENTAREVYLPPPFVT